MFCSSCGNKLPDGAKFCSACGTAQTMVAPSVVAETAPVAGAVTIEPVAPVTAEPIAPVDVAPISVVVEETSETVAEAVEEAPEIEEAKAELESQIDTSLDESVLAALETPEIPECEVDFEEEKEEVAEAVQEKVEEVVAPIVEPVVPVAEPVVPVAEPVVPVAEPVVPVAEPVAPIAEPVAPIVEPVVPVVEPVASEAESVAPSVASLAGAAVVSSIPVESQSQEAGMPMENTGKKQKEAFKFLSIIGVIVALAGCFLSMHTFNNWNGDEYAARTDYFYEFLYGKVVIGALAVALILLFCKLSSFAMSGIVSAIVSYGLFIEYFYMSEWDFLKSSDAAFKLGVGSFLLWGGLILAFAGLFIKFGKKKPLFKI